MAVRLLVIAHAATRRTRDLVFGDRSELASAEPVERSGLRVVEWVCGSEPACAATARLLGGRPRVVDGLAGPEFGAWTGRTLAEVAAEEPAGVRAWLTDPAARPHGGESLADLVGRVGRVCDAENWPEGPSAVVVAPLVARAILVHALGAPAGVMFRVDVAPLGRAIISRGDGAWRLKRLDELGRAAQDW